MFGAAAGLGLAKTSHEDVPAPTPTLQLCRTVLLVPADPRVLRGGQISRRVNGTRQQVASDAHRTTKQGPWPRTPTRPAPQARGRFPRIRQDQPGTWDGSVGKKNSIDQNHPGRVAPARFQAGALARSGQGDFHHPAPPSCRLAVITGPISVRGSWTVVTGALPVASRSVPTSACCVDFGAATT